MRVIITGGTGLIGRVLAADLAADGHEAIVLSRDPGRAQALPRGVRAERWDGRTATGWGALTDGADAIVNLAGENLASGRWTAARKERIRRSRYDAGRAVVQAVSEATVKPKVVIQASGANYYGLQGDEPATETTAPGDDFLAMVCVEWEAATAAVDAFGVRRVVCRTGLVLSRRGGILPLWALPFRFGVGGRVGSGRQWVPWIHIQEQVAAIRFLIDNEEARGAFNLCAPEATTNAEFSRTLARVLRRPNLLWVPGFAMRAVLGEMSALVLSGRRVTPARLQQMGYQFKFPTLRQALTDQLR